MIASHSASSKKNASSGTLSNMTEWKHTLDVLPGDVLLLIHSIRQWENAKFSAISILSIGLTMKQRPAHQTHAPDTEIFGYFLVLWSLWNGHPSLKNGRSLWPVMQEDLVQHSKSVDMIKHMECQRREVDLLGKAGLLRWNLDWNTDGQTLWRPHLNNPQPLDTIGVPHPHKRSIQHRQLLHGLRLKREKLSQYANLLQL